MKKMILLCAVALLSSVCYSQSAIELAKQQSEVNAAGKKYLNPKADKEAKKQAKALKKEGWTVPAGSKSIEQQITSSYRYREEQMANSSGDPVNRYIVQTGFAEGGTFNSSYAQSRLNAMISLASAIKTQLVATMKSSIGNAQKSALTTASLEKFEQKADAIVDETLTNVVPLLTVYRRTSGGIYEVQATFAFDKKEILELMKLKLESELGQDGSSVYTEAKKLMEQKF